MRFLMLNWRDPRNPRSGGAERVTRAYLNGLAERGHDVYWFAPMFPGGASVEQIDHIHMVRGGGIGVSILKAIQWYRRQPRFDLVIDQHHGIPWYAPLWCRTHCVAYIHEVLGPIWDSFYHWPYNRIGKYQERVTQRMYGNIPFWTASSHTRDHLILNGVKNVTLIPYGVDTVAIPQLDDKPLSTPLRLVVVSRLAPNKRVDHAVRVLQWLMNHGVPAHLTVVGTGEVEGVVRQMVKDLNLECAVTFTGPLAEAQKDAVLRQSHWLIHTSLREGWGLNVIEANAMGTPAAVYPVAGLVESTLDNQTGLVARTESPEALGECLRGVLNNQERYQYFRRMAWERAKTFHWSKVLPLASEWLEKQAAGHGG